MASLLKNADTIPSLLLSLTVNRIVQLQIYSSRFSGTNVHTHKNFCNLADCLGLSVVQ